MDPVVVLSALAGGVSALVTGFSAAAIATTARTARRRERKLQEDLSDPAKAEAFIARYLLDKKRGGSFPDPELLAALDLLSRRHVQPTSEPSSSVVGDPRAGEHDE